MNGELIEDVRVHAPGGDLRGRFLYDPNLSYAQIQFQGFDSDYTVYIGEDILRRACSVMCAKERAEGEGRERKNGKSKRENM